MTSKSGRDGGDVGGGEQRVPGRAAERRGGQAGDATPFVVRAQGRRYVINGWLMTDPRHDARDRRPSRRALLAAVAWLWLASAAALPAILRYLNVL